MGSFNTYVTLRNVEPIGSNENNWLLLTALTAVSLILAFASQHILLSDELYFNALAEQMSFEQIQKTVVQNHKWSWLGYVILPFFNLLRFSTIASLISLGYYFLINQWVFKPFFRVVIQAELVLLFPGLIKLLWFLFIQPDYSLNDLQFFYPLSLLNLFEYTEIPSWLTYPLQLINLFELAYWIALAYGITQLVEMPIKRAFGLVAASYGSGLLVWVAFVMFLTVSIS